MSEAQTTAPQPDPQAMAALMAKIAKIQKILGFLSFSQALVGLALLLAAFWLPLFGLMEPFAFIALAPFFFGLSYAANFAKKDLSFARVVFRNTAIAQLGLLLVSLVGIFMLGLSVYFWGLVAITVVLGGLPAYVIYEATKSQ